MASFLVALVLMPAVFGQAAGTHATAANPAGMAPGVSVPLRASPVALAVGHGALWVLAEDRRGAVVLRLDPATGVRRATFRVGPAGPDVGAVTVAQGLIWAVAGTRLLRVDPLRPGSVARAELPGVATAVAVGVGGVWVVTVGERDLLVRLNPRSLAVTARIVLPTGPSSIFGPTPLVVAFGSVWVADSTALLRLDPLRDRFQGRFVSASPPSDLAFAQGTIWALAGGQVTTVDRAGRVTARLQLPFAGGGFAIHRGRLWAIDNCGCGRGTVVELTIKPRRIVAELATGETPIAIVAGQDVVWVANFAAATLSRFRLG